MIEALKQRLSEHFQLTNLTIKNAGLAFLWVEKHELEMLLRQLRDFEGYTHLSFIIASDHIEKNQFKLTYMLHNYDTKHDLGVHVDISRVNASMHSIHPLWAQAWTYQRELKEMYGIDFPESPRVDEDFCLEGWDDMPPMRRDFDTVKYCEEHFDDRDGRATEENRQTMKVNIYPERGE
ncbi:MAG: NADH-quinone oxidoreductase subunit C [Methylococcales bacterium]|jgi:NADH-quinone oxidoreductase subunit C|nr:NADH-quinone oxidoreductase subunit C [Methylococcales bacterium]MBT7445014.1 NADH-quinone oxidoreductase subunit C [Methylococcales bacterium]